MPNHCGSCRVEAWLDRQAEDCQPEDCDADSNLFWCAGDPAVSDEYLAYCREKGIDLNSVSADPMFAVRSEGNPGSGRRNFEFEDGSPAYSVGFCPIDMSGIGLRDGFPARYLALDVAGGLGLSDFHRNHGSEKELYDFW